MSVLAFMFRIGSVVVGFNVWTTIKQPNIESEGMWKHLMAHTLSACTVFTLKVVDFHRRGEWTYHTKTARTKALGVWHFIPYLVTAVCSCSRGKRRLVREMR